jgi:hypothetical protein
MVSWQTVPGTVSGYLSRAMNLSTEGAITFGVEEVEGYLSVVFTESGEMQGAAEVCRVRVTIEELGSELEGILSLSGAADYTAVGNTLTITDPDYDGRASGESLAGGIQRGKQEVRIDLEPGSFSAQGGPLAVSDDVDTISGKPCTCEGDLLTF